MLKYVKLYAVSLVLALVFVVFTGCSEDKTETTAPEKTVPTVLASQPADSAVDVSRSGPYWILFSEAMNEDSVEDSLSFETAGNVSIGFDSYWKSDTLFVTPYSYLQGGSDYIITVSGTSKDLAGNQLGDDYVINFTTTSDEDNTPPTVVSTIPADNDTNVTPALTIAVTFDEPITIPSFDWDTQTFFTTNPTLSDGDISIDGTTLFLENLVFPQDTEVEINLTTAITDLAGNPMASDYTFSFKTATDNIRPTLVSAVPSNGATEVSPNLAQMILTFSEPMAPDIPMEPEDIDARIENSVSNDPNWNTDITSITVLLNGSSLSPGCTYWANFRAIDQAGNPIDPLPTVYSFTTSGTVSYFPVANGNTWYFHREGSTETEKNYIQNYSHSNGEFEVVFQDDGSGTMQTNEVWYMKKTSDAILFLGRDGYEDGVKDETWTFDSPLTFFKLPIKDHIGETWPLSTTFQVDETTATLTGDITMDSGLTNIVLNGDELEGTLKSCVKHTLSVVITAGGETMTHTQQQWLAPGVGWIKQITEDSPSDIETLVVDGWKF